MKIPVIKKVIQKFSAVCFFVCYLFKSQSEVASQMHLKQSLLTPSSDDDLHFLTETKEFLLKICVFRINLTTRAELTIRQTRQSV